MAWPWVGVGVSLALIKFALERKSKVTDSEKA